MKIVRALSLMVGLLLLFSPVAASQRKATKLLARGSRTVSFAGCVAVSAAAAAAPLLLLK